jgi:hypothetical protein
MAEATEWFENIEFWEVNYKRLDDLLSDEDRGQNEKEKRKWETAI